LDAFARFRITSVVPRGSGDRWIAYTSSEELPLHLSFLLRRSRNRWIACISSEDLPYHCSGNIERLVEEVMCIRKIPHL
jgi:hypothetical protein